MYPTPPSLEQNAVPSPCFGTTACPECSSNENDALKENKANTDKISTLLNDNQVFFSYISSIYISLLFLYMLLIFHIYFSFKNIDVWIPPLTYTFPESPEYSVKDLHFFDNIDPSLVYKPYHSNSRANGSASESSGFEKHTIAKYVDYVFMCSHQPYLLKRRELIFMLLVKY